MKPHAPACDRNRDPILQVLAKEMVGCSSVLEIGSGSGQHAVYFAEKLPFLIWQTSDRAENHGGIKAWLESAGLSNVLPPLLLDTSLVFGHENTSYDGVFSANTSHIMNWASVQGMFQIVATVLQPSGVFCLYGPFKKDGKFTGDGDRAFDRSLRKRDAEMGIRDLADVDELAIANGLERAAIYAMPANNWIVVWRKEAA